MHHANNGRDPARQKNEERDENLYSVLEPDSRSVQFYSLEPFFDKTSAGSGKDGTKQGRARLHPSPFPIRREPRL